MQNERTTTPLKQVCLGRIHANQPRLGDFPPSTNRSVRAWCTSRCLPWKRTVRRRAARPRVRFEPIPRPRGRSGLPPRGSPSPRRSLNRGDGDAESGESHPDRSRPRWRRSARARGRTARAARRPWEAAGPPVAHHRRIGSPRKRRRPVQQGNGPLALGGLDGEEGFCVILPGGGHGSDPDSMLGDFNPPERAPSTPRRSRSRCGSVRRAGPRNPGPA